MANITVNKVTVEMSSLEIKGATLLSVEEAELIVPAQRYYEKAWWLRSKGNETYHAAYVHTTGDINRDGGFVSHTGMCLRPALIINLENSLLKVGDTFKFKGKEFKIISNNLAWMHESDIGFSLFSNNCHSPFANIYSNSNIKKIVDEWYNSLIQRRNIECQLKINSATE